MKIRSRVLNDVTERRKGLRSEGLGIHRQVSASEPDF